MTTLSFTVLGVPQPAGSKRAYPNPKTGGVIVTDDARNSRPWKQDVAGAALNAVREQAWGLAYTGPVLLEVTFYMPRPKGHHGTGRNGAVVKPRAAAWPQTRPDATKLIRAVEDAMTGIAWADDAQVVLQQAAKRYGSPPRCEITVSTLPVSVAEAERAAL